MPFGDRGLTIPGHRYTGPFNALDRGEGTNQTDKASRVHDIAYDFALRSGKNPYLHYNEADQAWVDRSGSDLGGRFGRTVWGAKKLLTSPIDLSTEQQLAEKVNEIDPGTTEQGHTLTVEKQVEKVLEFARKEKIIPLNLAAVEEGRKAALAE